jgi:hypothetical protein
MVDDMPSTLPAPPPTGSTPASSPRAPLLFLLLSSTFFVGVLLSSLALTAALYGLGVFLGISISLLLTLALPLFLIMRANAALKRRRILTAARHVVSMLLAGATHAALFGVAMDWVDRSSGDLFLVAHELVEGTLGDVPVLSGILERGAEDATLRTTDGGPAGDGGPATGKDGGLAGDGGPATTKDGGAAKDAGPADMLAAPWTERLDEGRVARAVATGARLTGGHYVVVVTRLKAGGAVSHRVVDVNAWADEGGPTTAEAARDGSVAVVLAGSKVVHAGPSGKPRVIKSLSRGAVLKTEPLQELREVRDLVIAPDGALLVVASVFEKFNEKDPGTTHEMLLAWHPKKPGGARVVRRGGDDVPEASEGSKVAGFELRRAGVAGRALVVEIFHEGGSDVGEGTSGETWTMNPRRLLLVRLDKPEVTTELARTGDATVGLPDRSLQAFGDAGALADGRVLFDGNFAEKSSEGGLFSARDGTSAAIIGAQELRDGKPPPWGTVAPRLMHLDVEPDGSFAYVEPGAGIVVGHADRASEAKLFAVGGRALRATSDDVSKAVEQGHWSAPARPTLGQGGELLLFAARLDGDGKPRALLLASRTDLDKGVAQVLFVEGAPLPGGDKPMAALTFYDNRKSPLHRAP